MAADDRHAALRRRLAELSRQLRRPCDGATFDALLIEGAALVAALAAPLPQRARKPWQGPGPARMRVKRQRGVWRACGRLATGRDPGR